MRDKLRSEFVSHISEIRPVAVPHADDWDPFADPYPQVPLLPEPEPIYMSDADDEKPYDRKLRMLRQVKNACLACSMCDLGQVPASKDYVERDPHCFSNLNPTRYMVVGQNPGWNELQSGTPFIGPAGENFDRELATHGLSRDEFYICNANRCWTDGNVKPSDKQRRRCAPFLAIEINLLKPKLVVALGASAFDSLCPGVEFGSGMGVITKSSLYDVPVFGIYHPSPRNLVDGGRAVEFARQMRLLCSLIIALRRS